MLSALFYQAKRPACQVHFACLTLHLPDPHNPSRLSNFLGAWKQEKRANWNLVEKQCFPRPEHLRRVLASLPGSQGQRFLSRVLGTHPLGAGSWERGPAQPLDSWARPLYARGSPSGAPHFPMPRHPPKCSLGSKLCPRNLLPL